MKSVKMGLRSYAHNGPKRCSFSRFFICYCVKSLSHRMHHVILFAFVWFTFKFLASIKELTNHMLYSCWEQTIIGHRMERDETMKKCLLFSFQFKISHFDLQSNLNILFIRIQTKHFSWFFVWRWMPISILEAISICNIIICMFNLHSVYLFLLFPTSRNIFIYLFLVPSEQTFMEKNKCRHNRYRDNHSHIIINDTTHNNKLIRPKWKRIRKNQIKPKTNNECIECRVQPKCNPRRKKKTKNKSYIWLCSPPFLFHPPSLCFSVTLPFAQHKHTSHPNSIKQSTERK